MQKSILLGLFAWAGLSFATGTCTHETGVVYTFYGYADNSPPGANLAYSCASSVSGSGGVSGAPITTSAETTTTTTTTKKGSKKWRGRTRNVKRTGANGKARGTGTYEDPLTMAAATKYFAKCEIVYSPFLQKYLRYEDTCSGCEDSASEGIVHVDIWTGPTDSNAGSALLKCENTLTPSAKQSIVRSPPATLPVTGKLSDLISNPDANSLIAAELYTPGSCNTSLLQKVLTTVANFC